MNNNLSLLKIINGLSKTINFANQMLPLYNKIKPIITSGSKLLSNINIPTSTQEKLTESINKTPQIESSTKVQSNSPTFFQ